GDVDVQYAVPRPAARCTRLGDELVVHAWRQAECGIPGGGGTVEPCDGGGCADPVGRRDLDGAHVFAVVVAGPGIDVARKLTGTGEQPDRVEGRGDKCPRQVGEV